jgi:hypothetical protein
MQHDLPSDAAVEAWLKSLGVESLCAWDVLVFLHRHQISLVGSDHIAGLLGYANEPVADALESLEALRLVERSRVSQGARLYQFAVPPEPPRGEAFDRLLALGGQSASRLLLSKQLGRGGRDDPDGSEEVSLFPAEAEPAAWAARRRT